MAVCEGATVTFSSPPVSGLPPLEPITENKRRWRLLLRRWSIHRCGDCYHDSATAAVAPDAFG